MCERHSSGIDADDAFGFGSRERRYATVAPFGHRRDLRDPRRRERSDNEERATGCGGQSCDALADKRAQARRHDRVLVGNRRVSGQRARDLECVERVATGYAMNALFCRARETYSEMHLEQTTELGALK